MNNQKAQSEFNDCQADLLRITETIGKIGSLNTLTGYLTKYSIIRVSGALENCYKTIIADFYEAQAPTIQYFIGKHVREVSLNATYENICKVLKDFSVEKNNEFKAKIEDFESKNEILNAMSDINKARNQVAHGHDSNMTFEDAKEKFDKSIKIIEKLDEVLKVNLQQNIDNNKEYDDKTTID
jgi:hypothetical protein